MSKLRSKGGFTLIELLVVIVILAILMAIAIPTLLNQRKKAWDSDAKSAVSNMYKSVKAEYVEGEVYNSANLIAARDSEPSISSTVVATIPADTSKAQGLVYMSATNSQTAVLTAKSKSDKVFTLTATESGTNAGVQKVQTGGSTW